MKRRSGGYPCTPGTPSSLASIVSECEGGLQDRDKLQGYVARKGKMKNFKKIFGLLAMTLALAVVPASAAQADSFNLDITDAVMDLGGLTGVKAIDSGLTPPDPPATLDGDLTGTAVNVPKAGFVFPPKNAEVSPGITAVINMEANEDITGTFDSATGRLVLDANLKATVSIAGSDCVISPIELQLSSDNKDPYLGVEYATGLSGPGAIGAKWDRLPPVVGGGFCGTVGGLVAGPGGIWMSQDIQTPKTCADEPNNVRCTGPDEPLTVAPRIVSGPETVTSSTSADITFAKSASETQEVRGFECSLDGEPFARCDSGSKSYTGLSEGSHTFKVKAINDVSSSPEASVIWTVAKPEGTAAFGKLSVKPASKRIKAGKKTTFTAKIKNVGDAAASGVKICVSAPKKLVSVKKCQNVGTLEAGKTTSAKFKVKVSKKAKKRKKVTLKFKASGAGIASKTATAKVKVK
jgi:hypothetical protein